MGFLIIIPFAALAGWSISCVYRKLKQAAFGAQWWRAFKFLGLAGVALGVVFAFFIHYSVANQQLTGFPIPAGISTREKPGEPWIKSNMPLTISLGAQITDLLCGIALCLAPISIAVFFKENRSQTDARGFPRANPPP